MNDSPFRFLFVCFCLFLFLYFTGDMVKITLFTSQGCSKDKIIEVFILVKIIKIKQFIACTFLQDYLSNLNILKGAQVLIILLWLTQQGVLVSTTCKSYSSLGNAHTHILMHVFEGS